MEIKCTPQELKELIENKKETPVVVTTDEIPPHKFPVFNFKEYQCTCKEAQQEVLMESKKQRREYQCQRD